MGLTIFILVSCGGSSLADSFMSYGANNEFFIAIDDNFIEVVFNIIRGLDSTQVSAPQTYAEYLNYFNNAGLETYQQIYVDDYWVMVGREQYRCLKV